MHVNVWEVLTALKVWMAINTIILVELLAFWYDRLTTSKGIIIACTCIKHDCTSKGILSHNVHVCNCTTHWRLTMEDVIAIACIRCFFFWDLLTAYRAKGILHLSIPPVRLCDLRLRDSIRRAIYKWWHMHGHNSCTYVLMRLVGNTNELSTISKVLKSW